DRAAAVLGGRKGAPVCTSRAAIRLVRRDEPAVAAHARLSSIEAAVDQDAREPDFEGPRFTIRSDMTEDFDERVLNRLVGLGRVAKILKRDAECATLMR